MSIMGGCKVYVITRDGSCIFPLGDGDSCQHSALLAQPLHLHPSFTRLSPLWLNKVVAACFLPQL